MANSRTNLVAWLLDALGISKSRGVMMGRKNMELELTATEVAGNIQWRIDGDEPKKSKKEFEKGHSYNVRFELDDDTDRNLRFDCSSPFWVHVSNDGTCPPPGLQGGQIEVMACEPDELKLINKNRGNPCTLHYQLNLVDAAGNRHAVDPEFKNNGGG